MLEPSSGHPLDDKGHAAIAALGEVNFKPRFEGMSHRHFREHLCNRIRVVEPVEIWLSEMERERLWMIVWTYRRQLRELGHEDLVLHAAEVLGLAWGALVNLVEMCEQEARQPSLF